MYSTDDHKAGAPARTAGAELLPRAGGARCASRVVTRDEINPQGKTLVWAETPDSGFDPDYEGEIYRLESRGKRDTFIAHPIPRESANSEVAHIDWFSFTIKPPEFKTHQWVMAELGRLLGLVRITPRKHGLYGYEHSAIIEEGGLMAWGGKNQRGTVYVSLTGQGCSRVTDWRALRSWCEFYEIKITRIDFAHDDFEGRTVNIDQVLEWYRAGGFNAGGRSPKTEVNGDWLGGECGRTIYIGNRASGKQACAYEKGKQLGDPSSPWFRFEGRLSGKDRDIPLDALTRPGQYLAGMYPCLCFLSAVQCKVKTVRRAAKASYEKAVTVARQQYGKLVTVMLKAHGGDYVAVVHDLMRDGVPARLDPYSYHLRTDPALIDALACGSPDAAALVTG